MSYPSTAAVRLLTGEREPVRLATTANIDVDTGGLLTIDGVVTEVGDRVLVKDQTDGSENGIRTASEGQWYRASDARSSRTMQKGTTVRVQEGTANANKVFIFNTLDPVIGDDALSITEDLLSGAVPSVVRDYLDVPPYVATLAALKVLDTTKDTVALYDGSTWYWNAGNYTARVAADPLGGVYAKADAIADSAGAWVRSYQGRAKVSWWLGGSASLTTGLAAALLVGVRLFLDAGSYTTSNVAFPSNADLLMDRSAVIAPTGGFITGNIFTATGKDNIRIEGGQFNAPYATYTGIAYIRPTNCSRVTIKNVKVISVGTHGIIFDGCTDSLAVNCEVLEAGTGGFLMNAASAASKRNKFVRCRSLNSLTYHGMVASDGSGNTFEDCYSFGAYAFGFNLTNETRSAITNCRSLNSRVEGINLSVSNWCSVTGCDVMWDGVGGYASVDMGISINGDPTIATFNLIAGNTVNGCWGAGIGLADGTQFNLVTGNHIANFNLSNTAAWGNGVWLYIGAASGVPANNHVVDNEIYGDGVKARYGVRDDSGQRNVFGQNNIMNVATGNYLLNASSVTAIETTGAAKVTTGTSGGAIPLLNGANTWSAAQIISLTATGEALSLYTNDAGAAGVDASFFQDSASPAANDVPGRLVWKGRDSAANIQTYGYLQGIINDPTSASEDFSFQWVTVQAGSMVVAATLGLGYQLGSPTGGDKGVGTLNAAIGYYVNNQLLADATGVYLASTKKIDFGAGNYTVTHTSGQLAFSGIVLSANGIGYGPAGVGVGGTVTQLTSKSTTVVLNTFSGEITLNAAALAASTTVAFTLTNNKFITGSENVIINHVSGGTFGSYTFNARPGGGGCGIDVRNVSLGSLSEAIVIRFTIIKSVNS